MFYEPGEYSGVHYIPHSLQKAVFSKYYTGWIDSLKSYEQVKKYMV